MCLILFGLNAHPDFPLIMAANRDEFFERPTAAASYWEDVPDLLAGRDLKSGGTWMGVTRTGRIAAITNYRDLQHIKPDAPTRGALVADFLKTAEDPEPYLLSVAERGHRYNGFNLLVGTGADLWYYSNYEGQVRRVDQGIHGLSNALLDTPWPKVEKGKEALQSHIERQTFTDPDQLVAMLHDAERAPDEQLPQTGVPLEWERALSPMFIDTPTYGTRSSGILLLDMHGTYTFHEKTHIGEDGPSRQTFSFTATPDVQPVAADAC